MKSLILLLSLFFCIFLSGCVEPQNFTALENRVAAMEMENARNLERMQEISSTKEQQKELESALTSIQERLDQTPVITQEAYADMQYDIQLIKKDLQKLGGSIEEMRYALSQSSTGGDIPFETQLERLDQAISKNYEKIINLEKYMGFEPSVAGETLEKETPGEQEPAQNEEQRQYDLAKKLFDEGDNENARIQFENFINKYPESENADNARFWIADSYYVEKWYDKAILEYQKVLETYPDSNKLAAARLKQGYAFAELGEIANARLILKVLIQKHPGSNEAKYAKEKLKHLQ